MTILSELAELLPGRVFGPGTAPFDAARTVSLGIGEADAAVVPTSAADAAAALRVAASTGTPVSVRSGGHGGEPAAGGIVIDLRELAGIEVGDGLVQVGGGANWGQVADALAPLGLAVTSGDTRGVGVGGLALGGGVGWFVRQQGLTIDTIREIELATTAGDVVTVTEQTQPDLFWALRGGGGNFGVATRFTFAAIAVGPLAGGHLRFAADDARGLVEAWREVVRAAPETFNTSLVFMPPFAPGVPSGPLVGVALQGDEAELRDVLAPLLALDTLAETELGPVAYADLLEDRPAAHPPLRFVGGNGFVPRLSDELLEAIVAALAGPAPTVVMLRALGGAFSRVPADASALAHRDSEALLLVNAVLPGDASADDIARARIAPDAALAHTRGSYGNFTEERGERVLASMYPEGVLERLRATKALMDPRNVLRQGHNITLG